MERERREGEMIFRMKSEAKINASNEKSTYKMSSLMFYIDKLLSRIAEKSHMFWSYVWKSWVTL